MIRIVVYPPLAKGRQTIERPLAEDEEFSVQQLIEWLQSKTGEFPSMAEFVLTDNPEQHLMVLVNGKIVDDRARLQKGDTIKIVLNMAGG